MKKMATIFETKTMGWRVNLRRCREHASTIPEAVTLAARDDFFYARVQLLNGRSLYLEVPSR